MNKQKDRSTGDSWHTNPVWRKFLEILLIKEESPLLYPLLARDQQLSRVAPPFISYFGKFGKWAVHSIHPTESEIHPDVSLMKHSSSALTFSPKMGCSSRVIFSPSVHLIRATNPWLLLIYNRGKVILIMKKPKVYIFRHQDTIYHRDQ